MNNPIDIVQDLEIEPQCIRVGNDCVHWVRKYYDDEPKLTWGSCLAGDFNKSEKCRNPYPYLTMSERSKVLKLKPRKRQSITESHVRVLFKNACDTDRYIQDQVEADCCAVYVRDHFHRPLMCFFDLRYVDQCSFQHKFRKVLLDEIEVLVNDLMAHHNHQILLVMQNGAVDVYVEYLHDNEFLVVETYNE